MDIGVILLSLAVIFIAWQSIQLEKAIKSLKKELSNIKEQIEKQK